MKSLFERWCTIGLVIPGAGPAISGKVGGIVYSRNAGGAYARTHVIPINPNTVRQANVRATFGTLSNRWTTVLTQSQRDAWIAWGLATTFPARVVPSQHLSGSAAYNKCNAIRVQAGLPIIDEGPVVNSLLNWTEPTLITSVMPGTGDAEFTVNPDDEWQAPGGGLLWYFSNPQNAAKKFFRGPFAFCSFIAGGTLTPGTVTATWSPPQLGSGPSGSKLFYRVTATAPDGRPSQAFNGVIIVA